MKKSNFLPWVQIWAYPEHPPPPVAVEVCGDSIPQGYHLVHKVSQNLIPGYNFLLFIIKDKYKAIQEQLC